MAFRAFKKCHTYIHGICIYHGNARYHVQRKLLSTSISSIDVEKAELSQDELKKKSLERLLPWNQSEVEHENQSKETDNHKVKGHVNSSMKYIHHNKHNVWEGFESDGHHDRKDDSSIEQVERKPSHREKLQSFLNVEAVLEGNTDDVEEWRDKFGSLTHQPRDLPDEAFADDIGEEEESEHPYKRLQHRKGKWTPYGYGRVITGLCKAGKIYEAIQVLETRMLKEDRVRPNEYVFTSLIGGMGRVGYTKKAFKLFNQMKKYGLQPAHPTYTALFNACSNSPSKEDGLDRANRLRQLMVDKGHQPNVITFNAMIKAYGMLGDVQTAFSIMDEVIEHQYRWGTDTLGALLVACASQHEAGFKMAIEVWRRMRKKRLNPTTLEYNLLLRVVRDCGVGDPEFAQQLVLRSKSETGGGVKSPDENLSGGSKSNMVEEIKDIPLLTDLWAKQEQTTVTTTSSMANQEESSDHVYKGELSGATENETENDPETFGSLKSYSQAKQPHVFEYCEGDREPWWQSITPGSSKDKQKALALIAQELDIRAGASVLDMAVPDILSPRGRFDNVVSLGTLSTAQERLALLGGLPGILNHMKRDKASPNGKTFSFLIDMVPRNQEKDVLAAMKSHGVALTVVVCNQLIRKRNMRKDYEGAHAVLTLMSECGLAADVRTYGYSAFACLTKEQGENLLDEMEDAGIYPTLDVYATMLSVTGFQFPYKIMIMKHMEKNNVQPDTRFIKNLEKIATKTRKALVDMEHGKEVEPHFTDPKLGRHFGYFMKFYKTWLLSMELESSDDLWASFERPSPETLAEMVAEKDNGQ